MELANKVLIASGSAGSVGSDANGSSNFLKMFAEELSRDMNPLLQKSETRDRGCMTLAAKIYELVSDFEAPIIIGGGYTIGRSPGERTEPQLAVAKAGLTREKILKVVQL